MGRMTGHAVAATWMTMLAVAAQAQTAGGQGQAGAGAVPPPVAPIQLLPTPAPGPSPTPPARLRGLDDFSLSPDRPATASPTPTPTPTSTSTSTPRTTPPPGAARPAPRTSAAPREAPVPTPRISPTPSVIPAPVVTPSPIATTTLEPTPPAAPVAAPAKPAATAPTPTPTPIPAPAPAADGAGSSSAWWIAGLLAILAATGFAWFRRRRPPSVPSASHQPDPATAPRPATPAVPVATPAAAPASPAASVARAHLAIELLPRRGGLTMISIAFEGELVVRNVGDVTAQRVAVEASLLPARSGQDDELGALFARPVTRPAAAPFALAPGEERRVRLVAAMPLAGVEPLTAPGASGGRQMIVPVLAVNVLYAAGEGAGEGQTAASWIVGVARPGSDKLAPFWLDGPGLTDALAARPHALALTR
ncbi:MAG: hypothetical protein ACRYFW_09760 [Janthinobacterium lividum]